MGSKGAEESKKLKLYSSYRSTCSFRVRIALNLKGIDYEYKAVNLFKGEQFSPDFLKLNPMGYIPVLVDGDITVADSFAIVMAANIVSSSIQPLQNPSALKRMDEKVGPDESLLWIQSHIGNFAALEKLLDKYAGKYATGDEVFLADLFLAPQIYGAIKRFNLDMTKYRLLSRLNEAYKELPAFQDAIPEKQPDAPIESIRRSLV